MPALIEGFRSAGADVRASVDGDLDALPGTVGLAAYRILQEALTNAVKHAPAARATVHVAVRPTRCAWTSTRPGRPDAGPGSGWSACASAPRPSAAPCEAGPGGSGWLVHAELPLLTGTAAS